MWVSASCFLQSNEVAINEKHLGIYILSITFDKFGFPVPFGLPCHFYAVAHDLAVLPQRSDPLARLQFHAPVALESAL